LIKNSTCKTKFDHNGISQKCIKLSKQTHDRQSVTSSNSLYIFCQFQCFKECNFDFIYTFRNTLPRGLILKTWLICVNGFALIWICNRKFKIDFSIKLQYLNYQITRLTTVYSLERLHVYESWPGFILTSRAIRLQFQYIFLFYLVCINYFWVSLFQNCNWIYSGHYYLLGLIHLITTIFV
jgi:hypothetical protein